MTFTSDKVDHARCEQIIRSLRTDLARMENKLRLERWIARNFERSNTALRGHITRLKRRLDYANTHTAIE